MPKRKRNRVPRFPMFPELSVSRVACRDRKRERKIIYIYIYTRIYNIYEYRDELYITNNVSFNVRRACVEIWPFYAMWNQRQRSLLTQFLSKLACAFVNRYVSRDTYVIWFRNHPSLITQLACDYFARYTHRGTTAEKKKKRKKQYSFPKK